MAGIIYRRGTGNTGKHNSRQHLHIKDFFHSRAKLEMRGDGPGSQIDHPKPAAQLVAIGHDGDSFQRRPGLGETDEGMTAVEGQASRNARHRSDRIDLAGLGVGRSQFALARMQKKDLIALHSWGVREG